jgi:hypothetical protein
MIHGALSWKSSQQLPTYPILGVPNNPTPYSAQIPESQQQKGFTTFHPYIYHKPY